MHRYDWAVKILLDRMESADALEWLEHAGKDYGVIHELTHDESRELIDACWAKGAVAVKVLGELSWTSPQEANVDWVLIELPKESEDRKLLFELESIVAKEQGFMRSVDEGQDYIALRFT